MQVNKWAIALLLWGLALRLTIAAILPPGFDEAYYYVYTLHPDWSYFDHPPLVGVLTALGIWLTGGEVSRLTIRLGALLLYTGTLWLFYCTAGRLFRERVGLWALAIATMIPFFQVGFGTLTLPDAPLMFFWTLTLYVAACEFFPRAEAGEGLPYRPTWRLAAIGACVGLACMGKYHGALLGLGLFAFCLLSPRHRLALRSPWMVAALGLCAIAMLPMLLWNACYDWVSFRFQSARAVPDRGYHFDGLMGAFLAGIAYLFPTFGLPIWWTSLGACGGLLAARWRGHRLQEDDFRQRELFVLCVSLPIFLGFTLMGGYRQILPSWPMPGFFGATLLLAYRAANAAERCPQLLRRWLWGSGVTVAALLLFALAHVTFGIVQKGGDRAILGGIWEANGNPPDPSTQLLDLGQLRQKFHRDPALRAAFDRADFIFSNNFFVAGQVTMAIAQRGDRGKPITTFDSDLRGFAYWSDAREFVGKHGLYITSAMFQDFDRRALSDLARLGEASLANALLAELDARRIDRLPALEVYRRFFQTISPLGSIPLERGGQVVQTILVYDCRTLLRPYPRPYGLGSRVSAAATP